MKEYLISYSISSKRNVFLGVGSIVICINKTVSNITDLNDVKKALCMSGTVTEDKNIDILSFSKFIK